ncbi:hypothetical protein JOD54_005767 [Actinokineospora baliensis]|uniref:hypothetical protein n=1 Tax=Actinokineospora baliensis TaxID=547056 RepID=UPI00195DC81F|nr:hypothetical protein [Actinokineospora baliensis]MBM7775563.1 hypothetical protein [Actinokineospora baliensis]
MRFHPVQTPTVDIYAKLATGCSMTYESSAPGEIEFTLGGRVDGAIMLTFTDTALQQFLTLATTAINENPTTASSNGTVTASGHTTA